MLKVGYDIWIFLCSFSFLLCGKLIPNILVASAFRLRLCMPQTFTLTPFRTPIPAYFLLCSSSFGTVSSARYRKNSNTAPLALISFLGFFPGTYWIWTRIEVILKLRKIIFFYIQIYAEKVIFTLNFLEDNKKFSSNTN